jgi:hypothetical protein
MARNGSKLFGKGENHRVEITAVSLRGIKISTNDDDAVSGNESRREAPVAAIVSFSRKNTGATSLPSQALNIHDDGSDCTAFWEYDPVFEREGGVLSFKTRLSKSHKVQLSLNDAGSIGGASDMSSVGSASVFSTASMDGKLFDVVVGLVQNNATIILGTSQLTVRQGAISGMMEIYLKGAINTAVAKEDGQQGASFPGDKRVFSLDGNASLRAHIAVMTTKDYERNLHTKEHARSLSARMAMSSTRSVNFDDISVASGQQVTGWQPPSAGKPGRPPAYPTQIMQKVSELELAMSSSPETRSKLAPVAPLEDQVRLRKSWNRDQKAEEEIVDLGAIQAAAADQRDDIEEVQPLCGTETEDFGRDGASPTAEGGDSAVLEEARREIRDAARRAQRRIRRDDDSSNSKLSPASSFNSASSASCTDASASESLFSYESSVVTDASSVHTEMTQDKEEVRSGYSWFDFLCTETSKQAKPLSSGVNKS